MLPLSIEWQILILAIGLWIYDASLLLLPNEGVLTTGWGGRWRVGFGSLHNRIKGREFFLPNLLLLHQPIFRLSWAMQGQPTQADSARLNSTAPLIDWRARAAAFRALAPWVYLAALVQVSALVAILFVYQDALSRLTLLACIYAAVLLLVAGVFYWRARWGLPWKILIPMGIECVLCPPLSLNLVRKISLAMDANALDARDLLLEAQTLARAEDWQDAAREFTRRLDFEMESHEVSSPPYLAMHRLREQIRLPEE